MSTTVCLVCKKAVCAKKNNAGILRKEGNLKCICENCRLGLIATLGELADLKEIPELLDGLRFYALAMGYGDGEDSVEAIMAGCNSLPEFGDDTDGPSIDRY